MPKNLFSKLIRAGLALVVLAAGIAVLTGFDRMGHRFALLGAPVWMRIVAGLFQMLAAAMLWLPGRTAYGAALCLVAGLAATIAHATTLGWDSAPPAIAIAALSAVLLWKHRAQLKT